MAGEPKFLRIRNWERYQVFKDGRPLMFFTVHVKSDEAKQRVGIFDDPQFMKLADDQECPVFRLMGVAALLNNKIPNDAEWLQMRVMSSQPVNIEKMLDAGFLEAWSDSVQNGTVSVQGNADSVLETKTKTERKTKPLAAVAAELTTEGKRKQRDLLWEALVEELGTSPSTRSERGRWNSALKELREAGATAAEITTRCAAYRSRWPGVTLTPTALSANWGSLAGAHGELSAEERNRRWLAGLEERGIA